MNLTTAPAVDIALRTLADDKRRRVHALFDSLKNWENDPHIRDISKSLPYKDVYVLTASDGTRIFFHKSDDTIRIVDIASKETIEQFAHEE